MMICVTSRRSTLRQPVGLQFVAFMVARQELMPVTSSSSTHSGTSVHCECDVINARGR